VLCAGYAVSSFAMRDAIGILAVLCSEAVVAWCNWGLRRWARNLRFLAPVAVTVVGINALFGSGDPALAAVKCGPIDVKITIESLANGISMALRLFSAAGAFALLELVANQDDVLFAISSPSSRFSLAAALTLRLVPYLRRRVASIHDVQCMTSVEGSSLKARIWSRIPVLKAAVSESLELSLNLAEAMFARGWGVGPRGRYPASRFRLNDLVVVVASACGTALLLWYAPEGGARSSQTTLSVLRWTAFALVPAVACLAACGPRRWFGVRRGG